MTPAPILVALAAAARPPRIGRFATGFARRSRLRLHGVDPEPRDAPFSLDGMERGGLRRRASPANGERDMWHFERFYYFDNIGPGSGLVLFLIYFAPAIIAFLRGHLSSIAILITNLVFGWTGIGWLIALIWSFTGNTARNRARY
jgi:hypothetical protein